MKLCNMTERVKVFASLFKKKRPFYEESYWKKKEELQKLILADSGSLKLQLNTLKLD